MDIANVDIMDADGEVELPVKNGTWIKNDIAGKNYLNYDFTVILPHFKGHTIGGFGGVIKNMSNGIHTLNHAEKLGMKTQKYNLMDIG